MSHFLNILCCFVPLGELHLCNSCAIKQADTSLWRNMQARFANDICQSYCFRAIKLAYWFARNFFREIYVGDTADYSALYCTKEICCRDTNLHYYAKEIKQCNRGRFFCPTFWTFCVVRWIENISFVQYCAINQVNIFL